MNTRVCAMIVTFNRREMLRKCLHALKRQDRPLDGILVVENASSDGTREMLAAEFPEVQTILMTENTGASGGYYAGTKWVFDNGFDWIWHIDDEGQAAPDCLTRLLPHAAPDNVLVPVKRDSTGRYYGMAVWKGRNIDRAPEIVAGGTPVRGEYLFDFTATMIPREVVDQIGLPNRDFFIWFDDYEYAFRMHRMTTAQVVNVPDAVFHCDFGAATRPVRFLGRDSVRSDQPAWKTYYAARNPLYTLIRTRRPVREIALLLAVQTRLMLMDIWFEKDRWRRVRLRLKGFNDGVLGRMGKRVSP